MSDMSGGPYDGLALKVSPEALRSAAQTAQSHINKMVQLFEAVDQLVSRSQGYWQGEAGDFHRKSYEQRKEDIQLALNHPYMLPFFSWSIHSFSCPFISSRDMPSPLPGRSITTAAAPALWAAFIFSEKPPAAPPSLVTR